MLKRFLSLFLSIVMVLSAVPFQAFATEIPEEAPEAVQIEEVPAEEAEAPEVPEETEPEAEAPEVIGTEAPEAEVIEPEVIETEAPEAEVIETEAPETEAAEETEPQVTEPEETEADEETEERQLLLPPATHVEYQEETLTSTRDVRVIQVSEDGFLRYRDITETVTSTFLTRREVRNYPANRKSVSSWDDNSFSFETFEDLKLLCQDSYGEDTEFYYEGEGPLVISEDITLPGNVRMYFYDGDAAIIVEDGVTLNTADYTNSVYADEMYIYGTFINRGWSNISSGLYVYGTLRLFNSMSVDQDAVVEGMENVVGAYDGLHIQRSFYTHSTEELVTILNRAAGDDSGIVYDINFNSANGSDMVLEQSITIPENVTAYLGDWEGTFTIAKGVTLENNSREYCSLNGDVTVHGKLVNNGKQLAVNETLTFSNTGSYSGSGVLFHYSDDPEHTLSDWLTGLDLKNLDVREERHPDYGSYYWYIQDVTGLSKLGTPKDLQWNKEFTWVYNESKDTWEEKLQTKYGSMLWTPTEPDQGHVDIVLYKEDGQEVDWYSWYFGSMDLPKYRSVDSFCWNDYESGTYYFTVQSTADGNNYRASEIAVSDTWTYKRPGKSLGTAVNLRWEDGFAYWDTPDGERLECFVEFYYSPTAKGEPHSISGTWGPNGKDGLRMWDEMIQENGNGYYYFKVRPLSDDITKVNNGTWSQMSPAYVINAAVTGVKDQLDDISTKDSDDTIRDSVQAVDTQTLKEAMLADLGGGEIMDRMEELEEAVGGAAPVQVNEAASAFDAGKVSIVGANLNDAAENSSEPITLVLDKPKEEHILDAAYDNSVAVSFSMTLDNAADAENLEVPVKVTLPVPESINPDFLVILHYKQNGEVEELTLTDVHVFRKGNTTYASFVLDSFSDFVMTNLANNDIDSGTTGDGSWRVTEWGQLILSGEGRTDSYNEWNRAPWTKYADRITQVVVESGITQIGIRVFDDLDLVTEILLPDSVEFIQHQAFYDCGSLRTVTLPASADLGWDSIFHRCTALETVILGSTDKGYRLLDGVLLYDIYGDSRLYSYPAGSPDSSYTVPGEVSSIGNFAFNSTENLTQVELHDRIHTIGDGAFQESGLESIVIPDSVSYIGYYAFQDCTDLQTIHFQGDPWAITESAFTGVEADAYYPADNEAWTEEFLRSYGGSLTWHPSNYIEITGGIEVLGGKSLKLTAKLQPQGSGKITWSLGEEGSEFVKLSAKGSTATLTAVDVTELHTVTVIASGEENVAPAKLEVTILPQVRELRLFEIWTDADGEEYRQDLREYEWWYFTLGEGRENGFTMQLEGEFWPEGSYDDDYTWSSSNTKVATVNKEGKVTFTGKAGSTTFTLTTSNGTKASVLYKVVDPISNPEAVGETELHLMGGQSTTLKLRNADTGKAISGKNVQWSLWMEGDDVNAYATITPAGKLTTKKVVERVSFYAFGDVITDGVYTGYVEYLVTLYPATTHVEIYRDGTRVNGQTLFFDTASTDPMALTAQLLPEDALDAGLKLEISDKAGKFASYWVNEETGQLIIDEPTGRAGTVTIKATTLEGSKKKATLKIQFGTLAQSVEVLNTETELISGKSLNLKAAVLPANTTKKGVTWSLEDPADAAYVKLSGSRITAQTVYEPREVMLVATSKDGNALSYYPITILPKDENPLLIYNSDTGENVTKSTIYVDLTEKDRDVYLEAGSLEDVTWTVKGAADYFNAGTGKLQVYMLKAGTVTVTAKSGSRTATVTLKAANLAWDVAVSVKKDKAPQVASGKSLDLQAAVTDRNGRPASNKKVTWSLVSGGEYAKVTSSGKLTAIKDLTLSQEVVVRATAADGSGAYGDLRISVKPLATGIKIYTREADAEQRTLSLYSGTMHRNRSNTSLTWDLGADQSFQVYSTVYPNSLYDTDRNAIQDVTWKSSAPKVASIDEYGTVTCLKPGTTTITCTAADGSNQKISFKLTVVKRVQSIILPETHVVGGKSISLKAAFEPADATNKKLYWGIYGDDTTFAKIDQKGKLTTRKVTAPKTVWVWAQSLDGSYVWAETMVTIWPKPISNIRIWGNREDITGKTISGTVGDRIPLWASIEPHENACCTVTWKSSDPAAASVDDTGVVTVHKAGKTVTVTATAGDGSGKKATVKIKTEKAAQEPQQPQKKGSVYYVNFKPEFRNSLEDLAFRYTEQTGVPITIITAGYGTYGEVLNQHIEKATVFNINNQEGLTSWEDYTLDLTGSALAKELYTDQFNLYDDAGRLKAIGYCYESYGIIVNTALLASYGYTTADIRNFEDLQAIAYRINETSAQTGVYAFSNPSLDPSSSWRFTGHLANMPLFYQLRDRGIQGMPSQITDDYLDNYKAIWDLYLETSAADPRNLTEYMGGSNEQFINGEAVFYQNGSWEYPALIQAGMDPDQLAMIPIYCGVEGEEKAGLCSGTESYWAINSQASPEDIQASMDFLVWMVSDPVASQIFIENMGAAPFKNCPSSGNKFAEDGKALLEQGCYNVSWAFNYTPSVDTWRAWVLDALVEYSAGGSWDSVVSAFVDGWNELAG